MEGGDAVPRETKRVKITSPEKLAMINKSNIRLRDEFLMYLNYFIGQEYGKDCSRTGWSTTAHQAPEYAG